MLNRIACIDLDGVIADSAERFARAEQAKQEYLSSKVIHARTTVDIYRQDDEKKATEIYWRTAFTPELVSLDTLIDGVPEAIKRIEEAGYMVFFLTSRPESMREATENWLWSFSPDVVLISEETLDALIMKPASQQYVKTVVWKTGVVEMLMRLFKAHEMLVVDDEPLTLQSIVSAQLPCKLYVVTGLKNALNILEKVG